LLFPIIETRETTTVYFLNSPSISSLDDGVSTTVARNSNPTSATNFILSAEVKRESLTRRVCTRHAHEPYTTSTEPPPIAPTQHRFLNGLDDIGITLTHADAITDFESKRPAYLR
jgi:3-isopropylmalate dehydratase small subunit